MAPISKRKREKTTTIPTRRTTATKTTKTAPVTEEISATRRIVTRSIYKKLMNQEEQKRSFLKTLSAVDEQQGGDDDDDDDPSTANKGFLDEGCTTPKSEKHKIPEIMTCPPAPKKPRVSPSTSNCILQRRRPISFFAHPDLDKFFMFAMRDIKVCCVN
uniref:Uncharacterized protein n=1 Tax=Opuntia streptacantha TaxID=393608 RepID=A0A7C9CMX5_OPUST